MKLNITAILVACSFVLLAGIACEARSIDEKTVVNKRFLGSVTSWINNNIVKPIDQHVISPITSGVTSVINTISDPFVDFGNTIASIYGTVSNSVTNAVNSAVNSIQSTAGQAFNMVASLFNNNSFQGSQDPCATTCFQRINYNGEIKDYFFDRPNGCISKGYIDSELNMFNSCCDKHNQCLNSKCCTNDCQQMKNECDTAYDNCLKNECVQYIADTTKFYTCLARGAFIASVAVNQTCSPTLTVNRKICFC